MSVREEWTTIIDDIQQLPELAIDRCYFKKGFTSADVNLHVFADASVKAYGAVAYLVSENYVTFVMAKNLVAPLRARRYPSLN